MRIASRTAPPFRADHVGSLLRPQSSLRAREKRAAGSIDAVELRRAEDDAIRAAVKMQEDVGLEAATDGEFRRASWHMDFVALDQLCLSPQCGFASTVEGNALTYEEQGAKLRLLVEVADEVWAG